MKIPDTFFGAADKQMEAFMTHEDFLRGFLMGILFQGNLVIPDTFFYMSSHLQSMVNDDKSDWLETGLKHGAIVPSFRSDGGGEFHHNFNEVLSQGIQGPTKEAAHKFFQLDSKLQSSVYYRYRVWPDKQLGDGYLELCKQAFLDNYSDESNLDNLLFKNIKPLAEEIIPVAIKKSQKGGGLRRAEVYNAITNKFNVSSKHANDAQAIINAVKNEREQIYVTYLLKWFNYCYQFNQGIASNIAPTLNSINQKDLALTSRLYRQISGKNDLKALRRVIRFPSLKQLQSVPLSELLAVRHDEQGGRYFYQLSIWQSNPTEQTTIKLVEAINDYVDEIIKVYLRHGKHAYKPNRWIETLIPISNAPSSDLIRNTATWLIESSPVLGSVLGIVNVVRENIACTYTLLPKIPKELVDKSLQVTQKVEFSYEERRVNFQTKTEFENRKSSMDSCFNIN